MENVPEVVHWYIKKKGKLRGQNMHLVGSRVTSKNPRGAKCGKETNMQLRTFIQSGG